MKVDTALLCDAATAKDGLLNVLGGGITHATRGEFPAPLGMFLALRVLVHPTEFGKDHQVEIILQDEDGQQVTRAELGFEITAETEIPAGEEASVPIPWNFPAQPQIPHPGRYSFEILIDGVHQRSVPFTATKPQGETTT